MDHLELEHLEPEHFNFGQDARREALDGAFIGFNEDHPVVRRLYNKLCAQQFPEQFENRIKQRSWNPRTSGIFPQNLLRLPNNCLTGPLTINNCTIGYVEVTSRKIFFTATHDLDQPTATIPEHITKPRGSIRYLRGTNPNVVGSANKRNPYVHQQAE